MENLCNNCIHKDVCSRWTATWGMKSCENFKEERKGEWKPHMEEMEDFDGNPVQVQTGVICSLCGEYACCGGNFCKKCGADMRGTDDGL